ncbi:MAG: sigma-54 dependent transcriptional regulator [Planctomycetota bacterium]|nr:sigma-54 dependent transcriptional regulator [Planctomycetota bacterium]
MNAPSRLDLSDLRVLVVDDEDDIRLGLGRLAASVGAQVEEAPDGRAALGVLDRWPADLVLTDLMMPKMSGGQLLVEIKKRQPGTEVVILTGYGTVQSAVQCLQTGAAHFLTKPFDNEGVTQLIRRLGRQVLARRIPEADGDATLLAQDARMKPVTELIARVAQSSVAVLIEGESGTGKEVIAREIHRRSAVADRPFLAVNTPALPDTLLESELFGHERGAFTGADRAREGIFAEAGGGTVFLDEVSSMSAPFQGKLLRVLQERVVRRLGGSGDVPVEFRLLAATNRDLEVAIRKGEFREDLFYRLGVVRIFVPPLRARPDDIPLLANHFLRRSAGTSLGEGVEAPRISTEAMSALLGHDWPGNVRELENALQRAVIVCTDGVIEPWHLGLRSSGWEPAEAEEEDMDYSRSKQRAVEEFQRQFVHRALEGARGNISRAAQSCGMTRAALQRIMRQLDIEREAYE